MCNSGGVNLHMASVFGLHLEVFEIDPGLLRVQVDPLVAVALSTPHEHYMP